MPLKDAIKYKIRASVAGFAEPSSPYLHPASTAAAAADSVSAAEAQGYYAARFAVSPRVLSADDTTRELAMVFGMLDEFDTQPPFTIQRLCELALRPTQHHRSRSKYLHALVRVLSVTATRDAFPPTPQHQNGSATPSASASTSHNQDPIFHPIPFLNPPNAISDHGHDTPVSPDQSPAKADTSTASLPDLQDHTEDQQQEQHQAASSLPHRVDELDDSSGTIHPLSSTTTSERQHKRIKSVEPDDQPKDD